MGNQEIGKGFQMLFSRLVQSVDGRAIGCLGAKGIGRYELPSVGSGI